jgi:hypothetical protein
MKIEIEVRGKTRCDLIAFSKPDLVARRTPIQIFPSGVQGKLQAEDLASLIVRAPFGTRITLLRAGHRLDQEGTWRVLRMVKGCAVIPGDPLGLPGIRVPDLDHLDRWDARRTDPELVSSVPRVRDPQAQDKGWTFGWGTEPLKNAVGRILIEPDVEGEAPFEVAPTPPAPPEREPDPLPAWFEAPSTPLPEAASAEGEPAVPVEVAAPPPLRLEALRPAGPEDLQAAILAGLQGGLRLVSVVPRKYPEVWLLWAPARP